MKLNYRGIRFNIFLYLFFFAILVVGLIGIFQVALIKPYFNNSKVNDLNNYIREVSSEILTNDDVNDEDFNKILYLTLNNNICSIVYNENGRILYQSDSLGDGCLLTHNIKLDDKQLIPSTSGSYMVSLLKNNPTYSYELDSSLSNQQMILYGEKISGDLANYYIFVNTYMEPLESISNFIMSQYYFIVVIVSFLAIIVAFIIANNISTPIVKMTKSANKLASGDYNVVFESNSYSEVNDLAVTLNDATNKLEKVDELRKDLIANVSHDLKTPLTMIKAYAEMILDISGDIKEKRNEHLQVIVKEVDYLDHLIQDMQELSKMQAGYLVTNKVNFSLTTLAKDTIVLFDAILAKHNIRIKLDTDIDAEIYADQTKIQQVIYNYISNALKHSNDNSAIIVKIEQDEDYTTLSVTDFGEGIAKKDLPYIWDRYYKIDKKFRRNSNQSTGLGLAIVKAILESHKCQYGVESKIGKGSKFYFKLNRELIDDENV